MVVRSGVMMIGCKASSGSIPNPGASAKRSLTLHTNLIPTLNCEYHWLIEKATGDRIVLGDFL